MARIETLPILCIAVLALITNAGEAQEIKKPAADEAKALIDRETPFQERTTSQIEKLVNDLGHRDFKVRDDASKRLSQTRGALAVLRRFADDMDLERRQRVRLLADEFYLRNLKRQLRGLEKQKDRAPLDLLVDLVVENRDRLDKEDWKSVFVIVGGIAERFQGQRKNRIKIPNASKYTDHRLVRGEAKPDKDTANERKVVGPEIRLKRFAHSAVISSGPIDFFVTVGSVVLGNGKVSSDGLVGSFVFSDADIVCDSASDCFLLARGQVKCKQIGECFVVDSNNNASAISLFSLEILGLRTKRDASGLRVVGVLEKSNASHSGLRVGDVVLLNMKEKDSLRDFENSLRRSVAKQIDVPLKISRNGIPVTITLFLAD